MRPNIADSTEIMATTHDYFQVKAEIEALIKSGKLKKFIN